MCYDLDKVLSYNALWSFLDGNKELGKTFSALRFVCNAYKKRDEQFIYVRRTQEEIQRVKDAMFIPLEDKGILKPSEFRCKGQHILYNSEIYLDEFQGGGETGSKIPYRQPPLFKAKNDMLCGYLIPLSSAIEYKQSPFPKVKTIIFDEYVCEQEKYLENEPEKLISLCETVFRHRDEGRIICLSNSVSRFNPYFDFFNLKNYHINEFRFFKKKSILIGHDNVNAIGINDDYSFVNKMKSIPKRPYFNLIIQNQKLAVFLASDKLFIKKGFNKDYITYSMDDTLHEGAIKGSLSKDYELKQLAKFIRFGDICFETMDVKRAMEPFIKKV
ncbi:phage DNA encapsidation protein [Bartonella sp. MM73XJBT]|uniref:phage DNA encapsidation protein n=1 Tax=Bartonella sp. MM73XJBT TaxID=3019095 RepID=UPI0023630B60|nr:phage DNA encapsidation protein [Bartonella sp. MM73XJBT]